MSSTLVKSEYNTYQKLTSYVAMTFANDFTENIMKYKSQRYIYFSKIFKTVNQNMQWIFFLHLTYS